MENLTEQQVRTIIREELSRFIKSDRFIFEKAIQMMDGRNIQLGKTTGSMIGNVNDQKLGFLGTTPRLRYQFSQPFTAADIGAMLESFGLGYH